MSGHLLTAPELEASPWAVCGQSALAAVLHRPLADVRSACPEGRTWMSGMDMRAALTALGISFTTTQLDLENRGDTRTPPAKWPTRGLAWLQFRGPWELPGVPRVASLRNSHWVGVTPLEGSKDPVRMIFDVNTLAAGLNYGWLPQSFWERRTLAPLIAAHKRATGQWYVRAGIEIEVPR